MAGVPVVIGVTGLPGCGKSTASKLLVGEEGLLIDADRIAREILKDKRTLKLLSEAFGESILRAGDLDREELARTAFADKVSLQRLNSIMHPPILAEIWRRVDAAVQPRVIIDAPLLCETGLVETCHLGVQLESSFENRVRRVQARGWDAAELKRRDSGHEPELKRKLCHLQLFNEGPLEAFKQKVLELREGVCYNGASVGDAKNWRLTLLNFLNSESAWAIRSPGTQIHEDHR